MSDPPRLPNSVAAAFGFGGSEVRYLTRVQNVIFEGAHSGRQFVLRLTPTTLRSEALVTAELEWLLFLQERGVPVSSPIRAVDGRLTQSLERDGESFTVAAFTRASGDIGNESNWTPAVFAEWGRLVGKLHRASSGYEVAGHGVRRPDWKANLPFREPKSGDEEIAMVKLAAMSRRLEALPKSADTYGLIHADLHFWNIAVDGRRLTAFDFDNSEYNWHVADLGTIVFEAATCPWQKLPRPEFIASFLRTFLEGYRTEFDRKSDWLDLLPAFAKLRETAIFIILSERWRGRELAPFQRAFFESIRAATINEAPFISSVKL